MMLALGGVCCATGGAYGQARALPAELDEYFSAVLQAWNLPGGALAIVKDGDVVAAKGYGVRTRGAVARIDENTIFDTASLTKSFTAAMIATLVDEGAMRWDDPVRRHLPSIRFIDPWLTENITVRDFLAHRTGLAARHTLFVMTDLTTRQILDAFAGVEVAAPFRTKLIYSNIGYTVAGEVGAAAAKQAWEDFIGARLLAPLGLTRSTPYFGRPPRMGNCASGHDLTGGVHQVLPREPAQRRQNTAPAGAVQNSIADLARWMLFQLGDGTHDGARIISDASMREMHAPQIIVPLSEETRRARQVEYGAAYGLGWQVWDYRGRKLLWHSGAGAGQRAYMALIPEIHLGVAVLVNSAIAGNALNGGIASRVIDHYLGLPARDYVAEYRPSWERLIARQTEERAALEEALRRGAAEPLPAPLPNYTGTFRDQLGVEIAVRAERDGLHLRYGGGEDSRLEHLRGDRFRVRWEDPSHAEGWNTTVDFILNQDGAAERVRLVIDDEACEGVRTQ
jgi:CubicO group peptidase (beta-lactamase class C family)